MLVSQVDSVGVKHWDEDVDSLAEREIWQYQKVVLFSDVLDQQQFWIFMRYSERALVDLSDSLSNPPVRRRNVISHTLV
jgi:hypothetical protein